MSPRGKLFRRIRTYFKKIPEKVSGLRVQALTLVQGFNRILLIQRFSIRELVRDNFRVSLSPAFLFTFRHELHSRFSKIIRPVYFNL